MKRSQTILKIAKFLGAFALFYALGIFLTFKRGNFHFYEIESNLANEQRWAVPPLNPEEEKEVDARLNQSFHFFGSGGQCIAFLGEDNETILKFFKHSHLRPQLLLKIVPLPKTLELWRTRQLLKTERNLSPIFASALIAYKELKEETGVFYLHLNKRQKEHPNVKLIDSTGYVHTINLNETEFLLQRKAECLLERIAVLMLKKDIAGAKKVIDTLLNSLSSLMERGIGTSDPALRRNVGFFQDRLLFFDIGSFLHDPQLKESAVAALEITQKTKRFSRWLKKHYPSLYTYFLKKAALYEKGSHHDYLPTSGDRSAHYLSNTAQRE